MIGKHPTKHVASYGLMRSAIRSVCTLCLVWSITNSCHAQTELDSLQRIWDNTELPDTVRFGAYYDLIWDGYVYSEPDTAFLMAEHMLGEARRKGLLKYEGNALSLMGVVWYVHGQPRKALEYMSKAHASYVEAGEREGAADVLTNMANMYSFLGSKDTALAMINEGMQVHIELGDSLGWANDLNAIGTIHMARSDNAKAVDHINDGLRILHAMNDQGGIVAGKINLGAIMMNQGDYPAALVHMQEAAAIADSIGQQHSQARALHEIGACYTELGQLDSAFRYCDRSLVIRRQIDDKRGVVECLAELGRILRIRKKPENALVYLKEGEGIALEAEVAFGYSTILNSMGLVYLDLGRVQDAYKLLDRAREAAVDADWVILQRDAAELRYRTLKALHKPELALKAYEEFVFLNDSLVREENIREVLRNNFRYAYEQRAINDSLKYVVADQQRSIFHAQEIGTQWKRLWALGGIGVLLALLLISYWWRSRILKRTNSVILNAQAQLVSSEKKREALEVRTHIARDVHDQLGSELTKLVMLSGEAKAMAQPYSSQLTAVTVDLERIAGEANRSLGDIVWAIDHNHDSMAGLTDRVRSHCERMLKLSQVPHVVDCVHTGEDSILDPATKRDVYMIVRESLNNAIKYAKATHIAVTFHTDDRRVLYVLQDNGVGFDPTDKGGHGLQNMRERAKRIGADIRMESESGTTVRLTLILDTQ